MDLAVTTRIIRSLSCADENFINLRTTTNR